MGYFPKWDIPLPFCAEWDIPPTFLAKRDIPLHFFASWVPKVAFKPISSETPSGQKWTKTHQIKLIVGHLDCLLPFFEFISHYMVSLVPYS